MESNREVFLRMSEEHYLSIPENIRQAFLSSKRVDEEKGDWMENMKDPVFEELYRSTKEDKKRLSEREFQLREERRNFNNFNK